MKLKSALATAMCASLAAGVQAQKADAPFLRIGNYVSTFGEFDRMYKQNNDAALIPMTESEYAPLFTAYKLKVAEAKALGLDTLKAYQDECRYYADELSKPYLEDTTAFPRLAARERERQKKEVRASHILISVRPNALPADTLKAYEKAQEARKRILAGESFDSVADIYSEDPSVKNNHGDLGYFTALQMVQQFEDVVYSLNIGEVSEVFRTRFGFHFIKLVDKRDPEGQVSVRHIMKIVPTNADAEDDARFKARIDSLYNILTTTDTISFEDLARANSDDRQSAMRGGQMPWFSRSQILPEFANASFDLQNDGDISKPVRTRAGWHIIKRVGRRTSMPENEFNHMMERGRNSVFDYRFADEEARMRQLAKEYGFKWNAAGLDTLVARALAQSANTSRLDALRDSTVTLATINGQAITLADAAKYAVQWHSDAIPSENVRRIFCDIVKNYEKSRLESKYPDFANAKREYTDGMLVFEVMQRNVWDVAPDSATVDSLFLANQARYSKGGSLSGGIYFCKSAKTAAKVKALLAKGNTKKAQSLAYKVIEGPVNQGGVYDDFIWPILPVSDFVVVDGTVTNGTPMKLEECRGTVISDYQMLKEREFVNQLTKKHNPKQLIKIKDK